MRRWCLVMLAVVVLAGCMSALRARKVSEKAYLFEVAAAGKWQDSGVQAQKGHVIKLKPDGQWGDKFGKFGPGGNAQIIKDHNLISAPAYALLMKISCETNRAYLVAGPTSIVASRSGSIQFRANTSLSEEADGTMSVVFSTCRDSDGDRLSDDDEINIWKTNPFNPDTDGNGFTDFEDAQHTTERRRVAEKQGGL